MKSPSFPDNSEILIFRVSNSADDSGWYTTILESTLGPYDSKDELFDAVDRMRIEHTGR